MNRDDVKRARDLAAQFVKASDGLLTTMNRTWEPAGPEGAKLVASRWKDTGQIAGKATGAHRRLSLDLTRALAEMRRRS